jgi:hypothetical protein
MVWHMAIGQELLMSNTDTTAARQNAELVKPNAVEFAAAIVEVHKLLGKIEALCENPHWTAERRWRIADLSRKAQSVLEVGRNG